MWQCRQLCQAPNALGPVAQWCATFLLVVQTPPFVVLLMRVVVFRPTMTVHTEFSSCCATRGTPVQTRGVAPPLLNSPQQVCQGLLEEVWEFTDSQTALAEFNCVSCTVIAIVIVPDAHCEVCHPTVVLAPAKVVSVYCV